MSSAFEAPKGKDKEFYRHWNLLYGEIASRENVRDHHFWQLIILCDCYVDYARLRDIVEVSGYTSLEGGASVLSMDVKQLNTVISQISNLTKLLKLDISKNQKRGGNDEGETW